MGPATIFLQTGGVAGESAAFVVLVSVSTLAAGWVYRDAKRRGSEHASNWAISMFMFGMLAFFPLVVGLGLYREVREEFGT